jgi:phosphoribosylformylglycinamidine synthase
MPIAHAEGRYYTENIQELRDNDQIVLSFESENPNGSMEAITGVCDEEGLVCAVMPHPERASESILGSDNGRKFFEGIMKFR